MGLGKSAQAIAACTLIQAKRILVVCPAVARINWQREFEKFAPLAYNFDVITARNQSMAPMCSGIISYDLLATSPAIVSGQFDAIILDEAHFLKSLDTKRTKAVFGKEGIVHRSKRVWALTATPAPNSFISELWPMLYTFGLTAFRYDDFIDYFCETEISPFGKKVIGNDPKNLPEFKKILEKLMMRRTKKEVMKDLPPISFNTVVVEPGRVDLTAELAAKFEAEEAVLLDALYQDDKAALSYLEGLAQSVATLRRYNGMKKVQPVVDLVSEELNANAYKKIVLFTVHKDVTKALESGLGKFNPVSVFGGTSSATRQANIDRFQNDPGTRVFIGNIMAAGTAITLTAAHQVIFVEQDWVPGNNAQAAMRCHRIGQTMPVFVRFIALNDALDWRITHLLRLKAKALAELGL